jgi:glycosyltransferase involved in cell wall biosynthesis
LISVIIATHESEQLLVPTLAALVPGAMAGVVSEVIVADAGSQDATTRIADAAGCRVVDTTGPPGARLKSAAASARAPWLLFLRPGCVPDVTWVDEANRFVIDAERSGRPQALVAVFRRASAGGSPTSLVAEAFALMAAALGARPHPDQGLLISDAFYDALGGHRGDSADPETDLLHRIGRRRIVMLRSSVTAAES